MSVLNPWWVADRLRDGSLREASKARLAAGTIVLHALTGSSSVLNARTAADALLGLGGVVLVLAGLYSCYRANARRDNRAFVERYICLAFPLGFWLVLLYIMSYYGSLYVISNALGSEAEAVSIVIVPYMQSGWAVGTVLFFALMRALYLRIGAQTDEPA